MTDAEFTKKVDELRRIISPIAAPESNSLDEAVGRIRVILIYIAFDLEATKRENNYLTKMLQAQTDDDDEDGEVA